MEKICKRCNFRTPAGRAVCQVCGHAKFFQAEELNVQPLKEDSVLAKVEAAVSVSAINELFARMNERAVAAMTNLRTGLDAAVAPKSTAASEPACDVVDENATVFSSASIKRQSLSNRKIEEPQAVTSVVVLPETQGEQGLDELLAWFKSYGVDQPLILEKTRRVESTPASSVQHLDQRAA